MARSVTMTEKLMRKMMDERDELKIASRWIDDPRKENERSVENGRAAGKGHLSGLAPGQGHTSFRELLARD